MGRGKLPLAQRLPLGPRSQRCHPARHRICQPPLVQRALPRWALDGAQAARLSHACQPSRAAGQRSTAPPSALCSIHVLNPAKLAAPHTPLMRANALAIPERSPASSRFPGTVHSAVRMGGASAERLAAQPSHKDVRFRDIKCGR